MSSKYLHDCLDQFPEVSRELFGNPFDMQTIEDGAANHLLKGTVNVGEILEYFRSFFRDNPECWWFNKYWLFPSPDTLTEDEQKPTFTFHQLSKKNEGGRKEQDHIKALLKAFRHIELVSILLRFLCPFSFGILSPPVEYILATKRGKTAVETYENYLKDIRAIREKYGFRTGAEADMALWVLKHKCYDEKFRNEKIKQEFEKDEFLLQLRARNLVDSIGDLPMTRLAIAFHTVDNRLASLTGCYALEKNVKTFSEKRGVEKKAKKLAKEEAEAKKPRTTLKYRLDALKEQGEINDQQYKNWKYAKGIRDKVFHADIKEPGPQELKKLIETVSEIEHCVKQSEGRD